MKCDKSILNLDKHLIISFVCLPPNGSTFFQDKHLSGISLFEDVFVPHYDNIHYHLLGDLNSRTGTLHDFELFGNKLDILEEYENAFDTLNCRDIHVIIMYHHLAEMC